MIEISLGSSYPNSPVIAESCLGNFAAPKMGSSLSSCGLFGSRVRIVKETFPIMELVRNQITNYGDYLSLNPKVQFAGADSLPEHSQADVEGLLAVLKDIAILKKTQFIIHDIQPLSIDNDDGFFSIDMTSTYNSNKTFSVAVNKNTGEVWSVDYYLYKTGYSDEVISEKDGELGNFKNVQQQTKSQIAASNEMLSFKA